MSDDERHLAGADLLERLDAAIPSVPVGIDTAGIVRAGRRVRRRRRVVAATAVAAVAAVAVGVPAALGGWPGGADRSPVASDVTPSGVAEESPSEADIVTVVDPAVDAPTLDGDGTLLLPPGTEVLDRVDDPLGLPDPALSVALAYRAPGSGGERWAVLSLRPDWRTDDGPFEGFDEQGRLSYERPADDAEGLTFRAWAREQAG